jgi:hypothetical protein
MTHADIMHRLAEDIRNKDVEDLDWMIDYINELLIESEMKKAYITLIQAAATHFDL